MDEARLEALLRREHGPVEPSAGLRRRLASIPASRPRGALSLASGLLDATRVAVAAGIATLAASLLLGIWIGSARATISSDDAGPPELAVLFQGVVAGLGEGS